MSCFGPVRVFRTGQTLARRAFMDFSPLAAGEDPLGLKPNVVWGVMGGRVEMEELGGGGGGGGGRGYEIIVFAYSPGVGPNPIY